MSEDWEGNENYSSRFAPYKVHCTTVAEQLVDPIVQMANIIDYKVILLIFQAVAKWWLTDSYVG